jgi:hypothetical protein
MVVGDIPTAFGLPPWISLLVGTTVILAGVRFLGKSVDLESVDLESVDLEQPAG